jgi:hypothetical protein
MPANLTTHWNGRALSEPLNIEGACAPFNSGIRRLGMSLIDDMRGDENVKNYGRD